MLKFRILSLFFMVGLLIAYLSNAPVYLYLIIIIVSMAGYIYGSAFIDSGFYLKVICKGTRGMNRVTLTFDDGPHPVNTPIILDMLKSAGVKATFFCVGSKLNQYSEIASRIHLEGHIIGNHSFSHSNFFPLKSAKAIKHELTATREIIERITNKPNLYFRPPFGVTNPTLSKALKGEAFKLIGWSIRSYDLNLSGSEDTALRIIKSLKTDDIILLHDTSPKAIPILQLLLMKLVVNNRQIVSLEEMLET